MNILKEIEQTIMERCSADAAESWTASLLQGGREKCAQKFGEEAIEAVLAGACQDRPALIHEAADAIYHLMVLMAANNVSLDDVLAELARRTGASGIEEKQRRKSGAVDQPGTGKPADMTGESS